MLKEFYPLATLKPEVIKTGTGKKLSDLTLEAVMNGEVSNDDFKITVQTLELQAQIAEENGYFEVARNFRRAAELTKLSNERILEIYDTLRPGRSTKEQLLRIADELEVVHGAHVVSTFIREAAIVYEERGLFKEKE